MSAEPSPTPAAEVPKTQQPAPRVHATRGLIPAALTALLGLELITVIVTGRSLLGSEVGPAAFAARLFLLALAGFGVRVLGRWRDGYTLALCLLLLPLLHQFQFAGGRINGDGFFYFAYVRSFWKDGDVDFANEYAHYGLDERWDLRQPTRTGHRRTVFSAGPAVLWSPFFGLGELYGRVQALAGAQPDLSGYGPVHRNAVALGSLLYGFAAVLLVQSLLRRYFDRQAAFAAAGLVWLATNLPWYMVQQPTMSHAVGTFAVALFLWAWDRSRLRGGPGGAFVLGLILGVAVCIRWQNALFALLPAVDVAGQARSRRLRPLPLAGLAAGVLAGILPQMLAWKAIFGMYLLPYAPQGTDFVRLTRPFVLETLFSSRHGLLSWTPILWLGYAGLVPLLWRLRHVAAPLAACLVAMTYLNMCSGDWWAGASFSARRFDSVLPVLAFGLAASFAVLRDAVSRRPAATAGILLSGFVLWNALLMEQYRRGLIPRDAPVSFIDVAANNARVLFQAVGAPMAWPANWLFTWKHGRPFTQYDVLVGRYLFFRVGNLGGLVEIGQDDGSLLGAGWGRPEERDGTWVRPIGSAKARVFAPLDLPEDLQVAVTAAAEPAPVDMAVTVNGVEVARFVVGPGFAEYSSLVPARYWARDLNAVDIVVYGHGSNRLYVDKLLFQQTRR